MKKRFLLTFIAFSCINTVFAQFLQQQKQYARVRTALTEKEQTIKDNLQKYGITTENVQILILAYKAEKQLEIYAHKKNETIYKRIAVYEICALSGKLGAKRMQGDRQVPEGFYHIDRFNPASNFYLSLGVNYPNQSDRRKSKAANLGGDIFIHGECVTIGCLPMTNDKIKEIYLYAVYARNSEQKNIPVYIFPFRMTDSNFEAYAKNQSRELIDFWTNLKSGHDKFFTDKKALKITVNTAGDYVF